MNNRVANPAAVVNLSAGLIRMMETLTGQPVVFNITKDRSGSRFLSHSFRERVGHLESIHELLAVREAEPRGYYLIWEGQRLGEVVAQLPLAAAIRS